MAMNMLDYAQDREILIIERKSTRGFFDCLLLISGGGGISVGAYTLMGHNSDSLLFNFTAL